MKFFRKLFKQLIQFISEHHAYTIERLPIGLELSEAELAALYGGKEQKDG